MNYFTWGKGLSTGVLIWTIMAVVLWTFSNYTSVNPLWAHSVVAFVGTLSALIYYEALRIRKMSDTTNYAALWAITVLLLDILITQWFDVHIFTSWPYWIGVALVFFTPIAMTMTHRYLTNKHFVYK